MTPANVFQLELAAAMAGRRTLAARLGLPMLLGLPFTLGGMPAGVKAAGLVMLVLFVSFFGAAVATVRRREDGRLDRLRLLPIPAWLVRLDLLLAGAAVDVLQLAGVFILFMLINASQVTAAGLLTLAGGLAAVVVLLNLAGMLLASALRNNPEVHLAGALAVGLLAFVSGVFPVPARLAGWIETIAPWNPVARLSAALRGVAEGAAAPDAASVIVSGAVILVLVAAVLTRMCGRRANDNTAANGAAVAPGAAGAETRRARQC